MLDAAAEAAGSGGGSTLRAARNSISRLRMREDWAGGRFAGALDGVAGGVTRVRRRGVVDSEASSEEGGVGRFGGLGFDEGAAASEGGGEGGGDCAGPAVAEWVA